MTRDETGKIFMYSVVWLMLVVLAVFLLKENEQSPRLSDVEEYINALSLEEKIKSPDAQILDENTTLDRIITYKNAKLSFYFTNTHGLDLDIAKSKTTKVVCNVLADHKLLSSEYDLPYEFIYFSKNTEEIGRFIINQQSCYSLM